jgi:hypothetical protein
MSIQLAQPNNIVSLRSSAVCVAVEVMSWNATTQDSEVSGEITAAKKADPASGTFLKRLFADCKELKALTNHRQKVYGWFKQNTFPWSGSTGVLPTISITKFMTEFDALKAEREALAADFVAKYPQLISDAAFKLNGMFNRADYPEVGHVAGKFGMRCFITEVPEGDFRNQIAHDLAADLHQHYTRQAEQFVESMQNDQINRLVEVMQQISKACEIDSYIENSVHKVKRRRIHEGTILKALEYCDTFKTFNPSGSAKLEAIRAELETVLRDKPVDAIRESDTLRVQTKTEVDDILNKFGFGGV